MSPRLDRNCRPRIARLITHAVKIRLRRRPDFRLIWSTGSAGCCSWSDRWGRDANTSYGLIAPGILRDSPGDGYPNAARRLAIVAGSPRRIGPAVDRCDDERVPGPASLPGRRATHRSGHLTTGGSQPAIPWGRAEPGRRGERGSADAHVNPSTPVSSCRMLVVWKHPASGPGGVTCVSA